MKLQFNAHLRFWLVVVLLLATAGFLRSRSGAENLPPHQELASFPLQIGDWNGREILISDDIRKILGDGDFMQRSYFRSSREPGVDLFIGYFPTQRTGSTIHSPKNCLPGAGWVPVESRNVPLRWPDGKTKMVNRYVIQRGLNRQLVFYWYQSHDRVVASEYWAKFYMMADAIRMNRTDGALVRFITPLAPGESADAGQNRILGFTQEVLPLLRTFIPS
jgi:EpsI family protein